MGVVLIILGVITMGLTIVLTTYRTVFRSMPWNLHNPGYSFKQEYELHCHKTVHKTTQDLTFNHFLNLYQINPDKWKLFEGGRYNTYGNSNDHYRLFYCPDGTEGRVQVIFSKKDYVKFRKWNGDRIFNEELDQTKRAKVVSEKQSAEVCQFLLEDVQKDIDRIREEAQQQIDEARTLTENITITLDLE